jgi:hypothetical protein
MSKTTLFIPKKVKVGFQKRTDTYTEKLGYVIPLGEKGEYRKLGSWEGWRDKAIEPVEYDNVPTANFVLNKGVQRYGYWRGSGRSVVRIYDTRDFEFEITVDNLLFILMHADVSKRDIQVECVYAWDKDKLFLIPTNSQEYQESMGYTEKQYNKVSARDLVKGARYRTKKEDTELIYLGYFEWFDLINKYGVGVSEFSDHNYGTTTQVSKGKKHVFVRPSYTTNFGWTYPDEFFTPSISTLSHREGDELHPKFAEYTEKLFSNFHVVKITGIELIPTDKTYGRFYVQHENLIGHFHLSSYDYESSIDERRRTITPQWESPGTDSEGRFYTKNFSRVHSYSYGYYTNQNKTYIGPVIVFVNGKFSQPVYKLAYKLENGNLHVFD